MLILSLTYKKSLEDADKQMEPHLAWVKEGYDKGWFLASGRKNPRTGGVILAKGPKEDIAAFCNADPFSMHGIVDYDITEVVVSTVSPGLEALE